MERCLCFQSQSHRSGEAHTSMMRCAKLRGSTPHAPKWSYIESLPCTRALRLHYCSDGCLHTKGQGGYLQWNVGVPGCLVCSLAVS